MSQYRYVKEPIHDSSPPPRTVVISLPQTNLLRFLPQFLMITGTIIISIVTLPILYHELVTFPRLKKNTIISPLPFTFEQTQQLSQVAGASIYDSEVDINTPNNFKINNQATDLTKASNWFPTAPVNNPRPSRITHYSIDIPKLKIQHAVVAIGGNDLKQTLVQYAQTANPGEFGSSVIFGHSILRQFYNPSLNNPNRYMSIFSTIMTLEKGDQIFVNYDGIQYTYNVVNKYEVEPTQVDVLRQSYDRQGLKLITCTPEGTYLRRGVVEAQLAKNT